MPPHAVRWIREQALFLIVVLALGAGFVYLVFGPGHWRRSTGVMGAAMLLAGVLRAAVPEGRVGMLHVRGRWVDSIVYLVLGGLVLVLDIRLQR